MAANEHKPCICLWLHGWGMTAEVWNELIPYLPHQKHRFVSWAGCRTPDDYREAAWLALQQAVFDREQLLHDPSPTQVLLIGWSMGGMLAMEMAKRWLMEYDVDSAYHKYIAGAVCISSSITFIDESGQQGWPSRVVERMRRQLRKDPEMLLRTFVERFWSDEEYQAGTGANIFIGVIAEALSDRECLDAGLIYLLESDLHTEVWPFLSAARFPLLWLHGEQDVICLPPSAEQLALNPALTYMQWPRRGHALFRSDAERTGNLINEWLYRSVIAR